MLYFSAGFSPKMLEKGGVVEFKKIDINRLKMLFLSRKDREFRVGHLGAADLYKQILGVKVELNRAPFTLKEGDEMVIILPKRRIEPGEELTHEQMRDELEIFEIKIKKEGK